MARLYEPLWDRIRSTLDMPPEAKARGITISCPPQLRARIKKAVIKEKYNDSSEIVKQFTTLHTEETATGLRFWLEDLRPLGIAKIL